MRSLTSMLALLLGLIVGCLSDRYTHSTSRPLVPWPFAGPTGNEVIQLDVHLIEDTYGNAYLNQEVWKLADEQLVRLENKNHLLENGFRVGAIGGMPPANLLALLSSPRTCPDPRRIRMQAGKVRHLPLTSWSECSFEIKQGADAEAVTLTDAQCFLDVVPEKARDGQVRLRFTPRVTHGQPSIRPRPQRDPSGALRWEWRERQPEEVYESLSWEVTVSPSEYVLIGTQLDASDSLGNRCFLSQAEERPWQRLLVLSALPLPGADPLDEKVTRVTPLAIQASASSARGYSR